MLGGHGVGHDGGQEHNPQGEHEFEADPFAQPLTAGLGGARVAALGQQRQPGGARARGNDEYDDQQGDLGIEQPAVGGGHERSIAGVDHAVGNDDAGGNHRQHDRQGHGGETLQCLGIGHDRFFARLEQGMDALDGLGLDARAHGRLFARTAGIA